MSIWQPNQEVKTYVPKKKARLGKGRSYKTIKNKERELKKLYKNLFKASQRKKKKNPQGIYFCNKYPKFADFFITIKIKQGNISK